MRLYLDSETVGLHGFRYSSNMLWKMAPSYSMKCGSTLFTRHSS